MFKAILGMTANGAIGYNQTMPWPHSKSDMARFFKLTQGQNIIMGRMTFESLPAPLKQRKHYVFSRDSGWRHTAAKRVDSIDQLPEEGGWVIGGAQIYEMLTPIISEWHVSLFLPQENLKYDTQFHDASWFSQFKLTHQEVAADHVYQSYSINHP